MATTDTQLEQIIFNTLSQEKYDELKASGQINPNEIYLVPDTEEVPENVVQSDNYENAKLWKGTLAEYEALGTYDDSITYIITDDNEELNVYTKEEVDELINNIDIPEQAPNIIGGAYIDVYPQMGEVLYEYSCQDYLVNSGMTTTNNIYLTTETFENNPVNITDLDFEKPTTETVISAYRLPDEYIPYLVPAIKEDKTSYSLYEVIHNDVFNMLLHLTDFSDEAKKESILNTTNNVIDPMTPIYCINYEGTNLSNGDHLEGLLGIYQDTNNEWVFIPVFMWDLTPEREIQIGTDSNGLIIDWSGNAHNTINELNWRIDQTNENHYNDINNINVRIDEVQNNHWQDINNVYEQLNQKPERWEVENIVQSNIPQINGGAYIDVNHIYTQTLYKYETSSQMEQQAGFAITRPIYLDVNSFDYEAPIIFAEPLENPGAEIYSFKIPEESTQYVSMIKDENNYSCALLDIFSDAFYTNIAGLTEITYENKIAYINQATNGNVDPHTTMFALKMYGYENGDESKRIEYLVGVYQDLNGTWISAIVPMWNLVPSETIEANVGHIVNIDWNWSAQETINNLNWRMDELNNNVSQNINDMNVRVDDLINTHSNDYNFMNGRIDEIQSNHITDVNNINDQLNQKADRFETYTKYEVDERLNNVTPNIIGGGYIDVVTHNQAEIYGYEKSSNVPAEPDIGWMPYYTTIIPSEYITLSEYLPTPSELYSSKVSEEDIHKLVTVHHADHSNVMFRDIVENSNIYSLVAPMMGYDVENLTDEQKNEIIDIMFPNVNKDEMAWAGYCYAMENTALTSDFIGIFVKDMDGNYGLITHLMGNVTPTETILAPIPPYTSIDLNQHTIETLDNKAFRHEIPTMTSQLVNDSGFITEYQDISGKADITYVEDRISNVYTDMNTNVENINNFISDQMLTKADKSDTYTKAEVDAKVSAVYKFKGNVANYDDLPTEGMELGDVYNTLDTGTNYAWTEYGWDSLGMSVELTGYLTKDEASTTYVTTSAIDTLVGNLQTELATKANVTQLDLKADKSEIPVNISQLSNDIGYLTEHQDISGKADKSDTYTKSEVDSLLGNVSVDETNLVHKTGDETIGGIKTFEVSPLVPSISNISDSSQSAASTKFVQDVVNTVKTTITYWD